VAHLEEIDPIMAQKFVNAMPETIYSAYENKFVKFPTILFQYLIRSL
jgi:hypothetical protein